LSNQLAKNIRIKNLTAEVDTLNDQISQDASSRTSEKQLLDLRITELQKEILANATAATVEFETANRLKTSKLVKICELHDKAVVQLDGTIQGHVTEISTLQHKLATDQGGKQTMNQEFGTLQRSVSSGMKNLEVVLAAIYQQRCSLETAATLATMVWKHVDHLRLKNLTTDPWLIKLCCEYILENPCVSRSDQ
jgi:hypothetical protein